MSRYIALLRAINVGGHTPTHVRLNTKTLSALIAGGVFADYAEQESRIHGWVVLSGLDVKPGVARVLTSW